MDQTMQKSRVALVSGNDRYRNVQQALSLLVDQVDLRDKKSIVVKPNFVTVYNQLAATHVDAVRATVEFLRGRGAGEITLAEGPAIGSWQQGLQNYGYLDLVREHGLRLVDLNTDDYGYVEILDQVLKPHRVPVARTVLDSDFRVSVGPPKTHDEVIVTLSLKNYAVGSVLRGHETAIHPNRPAANINLYRMARHVAPHLAVIDGYQAMEGNGPVAGTAVNWRIAIASTDFLAADCLTARAMGFDPADIGYLHYCQIKGLGRGELTEAEVVGNTTFEEIRRSFRPHSEIAGQYQWAVEAVDQYL